MKSSATHQDLWLECARRGLITNGVILSCLQQLQINPADNVCARMLEEEIRRHDTQEILRPRPFRNTNPPKECAFNGAFRMGVVEHSGVIWKLDDSVLTQHALVTGRTGGGKSTFLRLLVKQILEQGRATALLFDRKFDFVRLAASHGLPYVMIEDFHDNWMMSAPGVPINLWCSVLAEIMASFFELRISGQLLLSDLLQRLQTRSAHTPPTLFDLLDLLSQEIRGARGGSQESLQRIHYRLTGLLHPLRSAIASDRAVELPQLLSQSWALGMAGLASSMQSMCITVYLARILSYRVHNQLRSPKLDILIVVDEASPVFPKSATKKTSLLLDYFQQARAFGIGLALASQSMNLADEVYANTGIKVAVGGFGHGSDFEEFGSAVGLNRAQREYMRSVSRPGAAVAKDIRYPAAFTVQIDKAVE